MLVQHFPFEILKNIFQLVALDSDRKRDAYNFALVCQAWHLPACHVLYEKLEFKKVDQLIGCLIQQKQNKGTQCKTLEFNLYRDKDLPSEKYDKLLSLLPNLQTILLDYWDRTSDIKQITRNAKHIPHIKEILLVGLDWETQEWQAYYDCATAFKSSIQKMSIASPETTIHAQDGRSGNMLSFLSDFTCLTTLNIVNRYRGSILEPPQVRIFSILRACPNLITLKLRNDYQQPEEVYNQSFDHNKLRQMDITIPEITKQHINYMIRNITRLKHLKLKSGIWNRPAEIQWMEKIGPKPLNQLQTYLDSIENVDFIMEPSFELCTTDVWSFMHGAIKNKRSIPTHVSIKLNDEGFHNGERMILKTRTDGIFIYQGIDQKKFLPTNDLVIPSSLFHSIFIPPNFSEHEIRSIDMNFKTQERDESKIGVSCSNILDVIKNCFTSLSKFTIRIDAVWWVNYQIRVCSNETDHSDEYDDHLFKRRSTKVLLNRRAIDSEKFAYTTLRHVPSAAEITSILNILPNTRYLKLFRCGFDLDDQFNFTLDLSAIHLRQLKLDISKLVGKGRGKKMIVIKVEESESNRTNFFKWKMESKDFKEMIFQAVDPTFVTKSSRLSSPSCNIITVKCHKIQEVILCARLESSEAKIVDVILDLAHNV